MQLIPVVNDVDDVDDDRSDEDRSDACVTGVIFPLFALCINVEMILTKSF